MNEVRQDLAVQSNSTRATTRKLVLIVLVAVVVPALPFLLAGSWIETRLAAAITALRAQPGLLAVSLTAALATDLVLPVPSGPLMVLGGQVLGVWPAAACSWAGLTGGSIAGYALARWAGSRVTKAQDVRLLGRVFERVGGLLLILTRPLPILAEACVLLAGAARYPLGPFLLIVTGCNAVLALAWSALGAQVVDERAMPWALCASVAIPLLATVLARALMGRMARQSQVQNARTP